MTNKVWLKQKGRQEKRGGYMQELLGSLEGELHRLLDNDASIAECNAFIERIREELVRSFKNGLMRGREGRRPQSARENLTDER